MKNYIFKILFTATVMFSFSCEDYLDKAPESILTQEEIFKDFDHAQGFVEEMYALMPYYAQGSWWQTDYLYGDEAIINTTWTPSVPTDRGDLMIWTGQHPLGGGGDPARDYPWERPGVWEGGFYGIRKANTIIENIDLMVNATQKEKNVILGQAYFFRAFFHFEIMRFWGRIPYIKEVLKDEYRLPRPATYKECALEANEDFKRAAELLPVDWDNEPYGQRTLGENRMRITKGAAYAFQGKNLLFAGSPLMKGSSNTYDYDRELCQMAVNAFSEVLKLDDEGRYDLVSFDRYDEVFWKTPASNQIPGSTEYILSATGVPQWLTNEFGKVFLDFNWAPRGAPVIESPTHNYIHNNFGMANGLSIEDDSSGKYGTSLYKPSEEFKNRDPRFYKWHFIDGDTVAFKKPSGSDSIYMTAKLYTGGINRSYNTGSQTGYFVKKFWPTGSNKWNDLWGRYTPFILSMRLTDVYLMYAEALLAATNSATTAPDFYHLTAEDAINIIRERAGVPHVHPLIVGNPQKFMDEVRRERAIELCYEGERWSDIRRWLLAHLEKYRKKTALDFPRDHSYFREYELVTRVCEYPKHYWLPIKPEQTQLYEGFPQNPGW